MGLSKNGKVMGRSLTKIDGEQVEKLAMLGCRVDEIAVVLGGSETTLWRRFGSLIKRGHANQKMSLRKLQFDAAKKGNPALLIWLGKQYLGQKDSPIEIEGNVGSTTINIANVDTDTIIAALEASDKLRKEAQGQGGIKVIDVLQEETKEADNGTENSSG